MKSIKVLISKVMLVFPDKLLNYLVFMVKQGYFPNIKNPKSLSEKIVHIKLYDDNPLRVLVADRIKVREHVLEKSKDIKFSKILWCGKKLTKEVWNFLPDRFILKGNHGSGMIYFIDKTKDKYLKIFRLTKKWMLLDYAVIGRERFYGKLDKYIIAEEILKFKDDVPPDYKFFCFNGKVAFIQVDLGRFSKHTRNIYNRDFERLDVEFLYSRGRNIPKPHNFERAIEQAEILSSGFDFIRVDLFLLDGGIYFGELTNTPEGGFGKFIPRKFDFEMGEKLSLNYKKFAKVNKR